MGAIWGPVQGGTPEGSLTTCCLAFVFKAFNSVARLLFKPAEADVMVKGVRTRPLLWEHVATVTWGLCTPLQTSLD